jgi:hypothetical protein
MGFVGDSSGVNAPLRQADDRKIRSNGPDTGTIECPKIWIVVPLGNFALICLISDSVLSSILPCGGIRGVK